ncbi:MULTISPECIES: prohibitin family protein [unclassified Desulfurobacterium]|uniref:prohibitin family protein n=1 Tax=Desulfurobacterium sp. TC5-1 TaxID=1158318 RepID=UPI0003B75124|nr:prohibitin family protein [Desulfurobacterium sp. TC5-1]
MTEGKSKKLPARPIIVMILFFGFIVFLLNCFITIDAGEVGVRLRLGKIDKEELYPGFHLVIPGVDRVVIFSTRVEKIDMTQRTRNPISALSIEGLPAVLDVTVLYRIVPSKADEIYKNFGEDYADKLIVPIARESVRNIVAQYKIEDLYSSKRGELQKRIFDEIKNRLKSDNIQVVDVLLRNVKLPAKVVEKIEEKLRAKEEAEKMKFVIEKERLEAERKITEAKGIAESNRIIANSLSKAYLQWYYLQTIKSLANGPNNTFIITPYDKNLVPLLNLNKK